MRNRTTGQHSQDNQVVLRFLAAHLEQVGKNTPHQSKLLVELKQAGSSPEVNAGKSLLGYLFELDSPLVHLLLARYGMEGFFANLTKFCLRETLRDQIRSQTVLGKTLVEKSKLLFNRVFYRNDAHLPDFPCLHSTSLTEIASCVSHQLKALEEMYLNSGIFQGSNFAGIPIESIQEDEIISKQLGFHKVAFSVTKKASTLGELRPTSFDFLPTLNSYVNETVAEDQYLELSIVSDKINQLTNQINTLQNFKFPEIAYFEGFEISRKSFLSLHAELSQYLWQLNDSLDCFLSKRVHAVLPVWPKNISRRMQYSFILKGQSARQADELSTKLIAYCHQHQLSPEDMLDEEWQKIDKRLDASDLSLLKSLFVNKMPDVDIANRADERQNSIGKSNWVLSKLDEVAKNTLIPLLLAFFVGGCGLKTKPVSKIVDPRPSIPFIKSQPDAADQKTKTTKK